MSDTSHKVSQPYGLKKDQWTELSMSKGNGILNGIYRGVRTVNRQPYHWLSITSFCGGDESQDWIFPGLREGDVSLFCRKDPDGHMTGYEATCEGRTVERAFFVTKAASEARNTVISELDSVMIFEKSPYATSIQSLKTHVFCAECSPQAVAVDLDYGLFNLYPDSNTPALLAVESSMDERSGFIQTKGEPVSLAVVSIFEEWKKDESFSVLAMIKRYDHPSSRKGEAESPV